MAFSEAQLCSVALLRVGQREVIQDLAEGTAAAEACSALYEHCRDAVLESFAWPFANKRALLAELANITRSGWKFVYALPVDCVAPRYLWVGRLISQELEAPFTIELEETAPDKRCLITDQPDAELVYTALVKEPGRFSPLFRDALAWKLAAELALALPIKPALAVKAEQMYAYTLARAEAAQFNQQTRDVEPRSEFIRARGGGWGDLNGRHD